MAVCSVFFRALMGVSLKLLTSALHLGPTSMRRRESVNSAAQMIVVWLIELASHWELQPDKNEIHTSLPTNENELPEGTTPDQALVEIMTELEESVQEVGRSSSVPFDWNLSFYTFSESTSNEMAPVGGGGPGEANGAGAGGIIAPSAGDVLEVAPAIPMPLPVPSPLLERTVQVGEFVAFALPLSAAMPLFMGRILEARSDEDGTELRCHWYVPKKVIDGAPREEDGKSGSAKEFVSVNGKLVPATGWEDIASASVLSTV